MQQVKTPTIELREIKPEKDFEFKVTITSRKYISPERVQAILDKYFAEIEVEDC